MTKRMIKFRQWDEGRKIFHYWGYVYSGSKIFVTPIYPQNYSEQFTGLKDSESKEVYEGDIIQWHGYIVKNGQQFRPARIQKIIGPFWSSKDDKKEICWIDIKTLSYHSEPFLMIGNIHENKELLND